MTGIQPTLNVSTATSDTSDGWGAKAQKLSRTLLGVKGGSLPNSAPGSPRAGHRKLSSGRTEGKEKEENPVARLKLLLVSYFLSNLCTYLNLLLIPAIDRVVPHTSYP